MTLAEAKAEHRSRVGKGAICPCCGLFSKIYKRYLGSSIAFALIAFHHRYKTHPKEWLHFQKYMAEFCEGRPRLSAAVRGGDFAKTRWLGLIEAQDGGVVRPCSGYWRLTARGARFVKGEIKVPAYVWVYGNEPLDRPVDEMISIQEALRRKFSYAELMQPV
jgi:hypothetical protein